MTLEEARENVGAGVVYTSTAMRRGDQPMRPEDGTIERVGEEYVFVRYGRAMVAATRAEDLELLKVAGQ
jgi:hypothetical protein